MSLERNKSHRGLLITGIVDMVILFVGFIFPFFYWGDGFEYQFMANLIAAYILLIGLILFVIFYFLAVCAMFDKIIEEDVPEIKNIEKLNENKEKFSVFIQRYLIGTMVVFIGIILFGISNHIKEEAPIFIFWFFNIKILIAVAILTALGIITAYWSVKIQHKAAIILNVLLYIPVLIGVVCFFSFCLLALGFLWMLSGYPDPSLVIKFWDNNPQSIYQYVFCSILFFYYLIILNLYCLRSKRVQQYLENS